MDTPSVLPSASETDPAEFHLEVWISRELGWRARVTPTRPSTSPLEFSSPFELARYVARPHRRDGAAGAGGLR